MRFRRLRNYVNLENVRRLPQRPKQGLAHLVMLCKPACGRRKIGELNLMRSIRSVVLAVLSGLAIVGLGAPAWALVVEPSGDIVTITFTGTVSTSTDPDGIFGCGATDSCDSDNPYAGDTYTAVFTFNTGVGETADYPRTLVYAQGGTSLPPVNDQTPPSPLVGDATVTVNGVTYYLGGDYYAVLQSQSNGEVTGQLPNLIFANVYDAAGDNIYGQAQTTTTPPQAPQFPVSITTPFSADFGDSAFSEINFDCSAETSECAGYISGDMTVSLTNASGTVPEPSTWLMMALGFAGLGFAGYRRARLAVAL
jgi:PEP-CTERM motif